MNEVKRDSLSIDEIRQYFSIAQDLGKLLTNKFPKEHAMKFKQFARKHLSLSLSAHSDKNIPEAIFTLNTALLFAQAVEPDKNILTAIGLYPFLKEGLTDILKIKKEWGEDIAGLLTGLESVDRFSNKNNVVNQENFRG